MIAAYRSALVVVAAGIVTFGVVFTLLHAKHSQAAPGEVAVVASATPLPAVDPASLAATLPLGRSAVGVPSAGSELLFRELKPGDRLDVLASLSAPRDGRLLTAIVVRGATVLKSPSSGEALLLEVDAPDAIALAHVVMSGTRLGYVVWPAGSTSPPEPPPLDEPTARALLGLAPIQPEPTPVRVTANPTPGSGGFLYQVQPGDTWDSVAAIFSMAANDLRRWNEAPPDAPLDEWSVLFIPRRS